MKARVVIGHWSAGLARVTGSLDPLRCLTGPGHVAERVTPTVVMTSNKTG